MQIEEKSRWFSLLLFYPALTYLKEVKLMHNAKPGSVKSMGTIYCSGKWCTESEKWEMRRNGKIEASEI